MTREFLAYSIRFILLIGLQVFLLNNVHFSGVLNPYVYIYFILLLPVDFSPNAGLLIGFTMGIIIDLISQTMGMHTIATVFLAYARPFVLRYMAPRDGYEFTRSIGLNRMGWLWFLTYTSIMVFLHHFVLFFIETFRMSGIFYTIGKAFSSSLLTLLIILVIQLLFSPSTKSGK